MSNKRDTLFFLEQQNIFHEKETKHKECKGDPRGISTKATDPPK
jgi:hypothetical protein